VRFTAAASVGTGVEATRVVALCIGPANASVNIISQFVSDRRDVSVSYAKFFIENRYEFARQHGYRLCLSFSSLDTSRSINWHRFLLVILSQKFGSTWNLWVDGDVVFTSFNQSIEQTLDPWLRGVEPRPRFVFTGYGGPPNPLKSATTAPVPVNDGAFMMDSSLVSTATLLDLYNRFPDKLFHNLQDNAAVDAFITVFNDKYRQVGLTIPEHTIATWYEVWRPGDLNIHYAGFQGDKYRTILETHSHYNYSRDVYPRAVDIYKLMAQTMKGYGEISYFLRVKEACHGQASVIASQIILLDDYDLCLCHPLKLEVP
jgi:hypothetical protein